MNPQNDSRFLWILIQDGSNGETVEFQKRKKQLIDNVSYLINQGYTETLQCYSCKFLLNDNHLKLTVCNYCGDTRLSKRTYLTGYLEFLKSDNSEDFIRESIKCNFC